VKFKFQISAFFVVVAVANNVIVAAKKVEKVAGRHAS
jgi:hypothetical protein